MFETWRYDFHNFNDGFYYEICTIMFVVYDHFQYLGELYVGSNHGITRVLLVKWRLSSNLQEASWPISVEREWYADHVHFWACQGGSCDSLRSVAFGDWFGFVLAEDGRLWMGGEYSVGVICWKADLTK